MRARSKRRTKGTPTPYAGTTFRSHLEASWANRFDWLGVGWVYEPVRVRLVKSGEHYTPDFSLPAYRVWVEVKPRDPWEVELERAAEAAGVLGGEVFFLCGTPRAPNFWGSRNTGEGWYFVPLVAGDLPFPIEPPGHTTGRTSGCEFVCTTSGGSRMSAWIAPAPKSGGGNGGGNFEKAPPGNHPARLVAIVDMGQQWQDGYQGEAGKYQHRVYFVWELVTKKMSGSNRNHLVAIDLTLSMHEKAKMRLWIGARRGKPISDDEARSFDVSSELGQPCLLNVIEKNGYPKIDGVSGVPDGFTVPDAQNKPFAWRLETAVKTGKIDLPTWLPYFYGQPVGEAIKGAQEFEGVAVEVVNGPSSAAASGGVAATHAPASSAPAGSSPPPPPRRSTPAAEPQFFLDAGEISGIDHTVLYSVSKIKAFVEARKELDWDNAQVCKQGGDWEPLTHAIPAAKDWLPIPF